jgi:hypothetical protein
MNMFIEVTGVDHVDGNLVDQPTVINTDDIHAVWETHEEGLCMIKMRNSSPLLVRDSYKKLRCILTGVIFVETADE